MAEEKAGDAFQAIASRVEPILSGLIELSFDLAAVLVEALAAL